jgi:hypothetical protein
MYKKLSILIILLITSSQAFSVYRKSPDGIAIRLGAGDTSMYSTVYYICPDGSNANAGTSVDAPKKSVFSDANGTGAWDLLNTLPANGALAFCRGGVFPANAHAVVINYNAKAETPITIRDYQKTTGSQEPPLFLLTGTAPRLFNFEDSGGANTEEGVILTNFEVTHSSKGKGSLLRTYNDIDNLSVINVRCYGLGLAIVGNKSALADIRSAAEVIDDLTFTHNVSGMDTIERVSGTWGANVKRGDGVYVTGSTSNDHTGKPYRVDSRSADGKTLYLTNYTDWEAIDDPNSVVNEANTVGVSITIRTSDGKDSAMLVKNSLFEGNESGAIFAPLGTGTRIEDSEFNNNGFERATLDHNLYFSDSDHSIITNNVVHNNNLRLGGNCGSVSLVVHGVVDHMTISNNWLLQPENRSGDPCYGIAVDSGAYTYQESFRDIVVDNNTLVNFGAVGIGFGSVIGGTISNNTIICSKDVGACNGIAVPDQTLVATYSNPKTSNITITNNKIYGKGTSATGSLAYGIKAIGDAADTEGTIDITNNTIDSYYTCIKTPVNTGATVTITGNTTTNCGAGGGQQP